jgi:hypothetical protein
VVTGSSEKHKKFIQAIETAIEMHQRLRSELPWYKLFDNKVSKDYRESRKVGIIIGTVPAEQVRQTRRSPDQYSTHLI